MPLAAWRLVGGFVAGFSFRVGLHSLLWPGLEPPANPGRTDGDFVLRLPAIKIASPVDFCLGVNLHRVPPGLPEASSPGHTALRHLD